MKLVNSGLLCIAGGRSWTGAGLRALVDEMVEWPRTPYEQAIERIGDAELVVVNKTYIDDPILDACPNLRWDRV